MTFAENDRELGYSPTLGYGMLHEWLHGKFDLKAEQPKPRADYEQKEILGRSEINSHRES